MSNKCEKNNECGKCVDCRCNQENNGCDICHNKAIKLFVDEFDNKWELCDDSLCKAQVNNIVRIRKEKLDL